MSQTFVQLLSVRNEAEISKPEEERGRASGGSEQTTDQDFKAMSF